MDYMNKYTLITGGSSGIGKAIAVEFAKQGKNLILVARDQNGLDKVKKELGEKYSDVHVITITTDLTDSKKVRELYASLSKYHIETFINNAGVGIFGKISEEVIDSTEAMIKLNAIAPILLSILYVKDYKNIVGSQLINISASTSYLIPEGAVTYSATKFLLSSFSEGLIHELKKDKAKLMVKILAPSTARTNFANQATKTTNYDYDKNHKKYSSSEEVAEYLMKLYASDKVIGLVSRDTFEFKLMDTIFPYSPKQT